MKKLDLNKTVYQLTEEYHELVDILAEIGFKLIKNPTARKTLGKVMTIPKGCEKQGKDLNEVIAFLKEKGFEVIGE